MSTAETTGTRAYATTSAHVNLKARWQDHIGRIVLDGWLGTHNTLAVHLSPDAARDLIRQLQDAVYESDG